jgi:hypothetical protein
MQVERDAHRGDAQPGAQSAAPGVLADAHPPVFVGHQEPVT